MGTNPCGDIAAYAGYLTDSDELLSCTSGGIATALSRQMIRNGGYVAGVAYSDDFYEAVYELTNREDMLERFKGSKYADPKKGTIYQDVKNLLEQDIPVLFFGLPCTVAALKNFVGGDHDKLITAELICHGPTSLKVHRQYIEYLERKHNSKVVDFSVRKKDGAWTPGYLYAKFENGTIFQKDFYHTEYGYAFSVTGKKSCFNCRFRGANRTADIMLGDFWGATEEDPFWHKNGVSCILTHTEKGEAFLYSVENISLFDTTFDRIVAKNKNIVASRAPHPYRKKFDSLFETHDLFYAAKHSRSVVSKVKSLIKHMMPTALVK